jgi:hypothetical protein
MYATAVIATISNVAVGLLRANCGCFVLFCLLLISVQVEVHMERERCEDAYCLVFNSIF